ncbi:MAG: hypothetical protein D6772_14900 [Bacteroidetes bacterium]|nr:MAG: hypothetical protein D6772_14900 [Bacteroidota bacterium]
MQVLASIRLAWQTARDFGLGWTLRRLGYEIQLRAGWHRRRMPMRAWYEKEYQHWLTTTRSPEELLREWRISRPKFLYQPADFRNLRALIAPLLGDLPIHSNPTRLRFFSAETFPVDWPASWFTNPFTTPPSQCDPTKHWSAYPMYTSEYEDLKYIWEPGRFTQVYELVRAYVLGADQTAAEQYWQLVESWIEHNPPNTGPHWKCGQETSLRLLAWYVGLFAFVDDPATTPERFARLLGAVAAQADRVTKDWRYSYLQQSNHAASEGMGLYLTGLFFPQLRHAAEWRKLGKYILEERVEFLFRPDGTYFQKSHNYLRFIVQVYLVVQRVADLNEDALAPAIHTRLQAALTYLESVLDRPSGYAPNFGSNDGALVLPFNSCDFRDFRPTIGALHYYFRREQCFVPGPWSEDLGWLFGAQALQTPICELPPAQSSRFDHSGIYTLRGSESWAFTHAESITDRPAHADALHLDIWWRGLNLVCDPGTYLYYGHPPWRDAFKHTRFHNTVTVDRKDQMERGYRFTWGYWHDCRTNAMLVAGPVQWLEVEHEGYHRLPDPVTHRRTTILIDDCWIIIDDLIGQAVHDLGLHWLLADSSYEEINHSLRLSTQVGTWQLACWNLNQVAGPQRLPLNIQEGTSTKLPGGQAAFYYGKLTPALQLEARVNDQLPVRLLTVMGPHGWLLHLKAEKWTLTTHKDRYELWINEVGRSPVVREAKTVV